MTQNTPPMSKLSEHLLAVIRAKAISHILAANGFIWLAEDEVLDLIRTHEQQQAEVLGEAREALHAAWKLSTWTACIDWHGGGNHREWLDDLRTLLESYQSKHKAALAKLDQLLPERNQG